MADFDRLYTQIYDEDNEEGQENYITNGVDETPPIDHEQKLQLPPSQLKGYRLRPNHLHQNNHPTSPLANEETVVPKWHVPKLTSGGFDKTKHKTWRKKLKHILHHKYTHWILGFCLLIDILVVIIDIYFEIADYEIQVEELRHMLDLCVNGGECSDYLEPAPFEDLVHLLREISKYILAMFLVEHVLMWIAMRGRYFENYWYLCDFTVVLISFLMEILWEELGEWHLVASNGGILVVFRSWRFLRITYGVVESNRDQEMLKFATTVIKHEKALLRWLHPDEVFEDKDAEPGAPPIQPVFPDELADALDLFLHHKKKTDLERVVSKAVTRAWTVVREATIGSPMNSGTLHRSGTLSKDPTNLTHSGSNNAISRQVSLPRRGPSIAFGNPNLTQRSWE